MTLLFFLNIVLLWYLGGGEIAQLLASLSVRPAIHVRALARSAYFRIVEFYQGAIDLFPPVLMTGSTKAVHVLSCLCDNACKRSLAICCMSRHCVPLVSVCLSLYGLHALNRDVNMIQINKNKQTKYD